MFLNNFQDRPGPERILLWLSSDTGFSPFYHWSKNVKSHRHFVQYNTNIQIGISGSFCSQRICTRMRQVESASASMPADQSTRLADAHTRYTRRTLQGTDGCTCWPFEPSIPPFQCHKKSSRNELTILYVRQVFSHVIRELKEWWSNHRQQRGSMSQK